MKLLRLYKLFNKMGLRKNLMIASLVGCLAGGGAYSHGLYRGLIHQPVEPEIVQRHRWFSKIKRGLENDKHIYQLPLHTQEMIAEYKQRTSQERVNALVEKIDLQVIKITSQPEFIAYAEQRHQRNKGIMKEARVGGALMWLCFSLFYGLGPNRREKTSN